MQPTGSQILTCKNESANKKERKNVRNEQIVVIKLGKSVWCVLTGIVISIIATAVASTIVIIVSSQMNPKGDEELGRNMKCLEL